MAIPSSETKSYDALLTTTLYNFQASGGLVDAISTSNAFLFQLMKRDKQGYVVKNSIGAKAQVPLMYALGTFDSYDGYDTLDVTPMDGITSALFDWRQASIPIAISGKEEKMNKGEEALIDLMSSKVEQATMGIQEGLNKAILQGSGGSSITTPYTSAANGSQFVDPLPLLVHYLPTGAATVGNIAQATYSWWQNQYKESAATTFAGLLKEFDHVKNDCTKGPGGPPNLYLADQAVFECYVAALRSYHQNPSYQSADIPFENVTIYGKPMVWDEFVANAYAGSATQSTAQGTLYFLNTQFWQVQVDGSTNFTNTPFLKPVNQDAKVAHILWMGACCVKNRRKQGVLHKIVTTMTT